MTKRWSPRWWWADERWLFLAFQSPLAHPDERAHKCARHVRLWRMDASTGIVAGQIAHQVTYRSDLNSQTAGFVLVDTG